VAYFEAGSYFTPELLKKKLIHQVVMQFLEEPTFNQLRTIEQLGYVVYSRRCTYRGVMGA
jgi:secreted Zn-dependent insulinase-like peptidase